MTGMDDFEHSEKTLQDLKEQLEAVREKEKLKRLAASWRDNFDDRQLKEIVFCQIYRDDFAHGTDGHILRILVAEMAMLLDNNYPLIVNATYEEGITNEKGNKI